MTLSFKYKLIKRLDGTEVKTPSIPVILKGTEILETVALLDSGADISAMSKEMAETLGLDLNGKKTPSYGVGGKVDSIETNMNVLVEKGHERYSFSIPVKVILGDFDFPVLLGRVGFFDNFVITFDQTNERVSLKKALNNY